MRLQFPKAKFKGNQHIVSGQSKHVNEKNRDYQISTPKATGLQDHQAGHRSIWQEKIYISYKSRIFKQITRTQFSHKNKTKNIVNTPKSIIKMLNHLDGFDINHQTTIRSSSFATAGVGFSAEHPTALGASTLDKCSSTCGTHTLAKPVCSSKRFSWSVPLCLTKQILGCPHN